MKIFWHASRQTVPSISTAPPEVNPELETAGESFPPRDPGMKQSVADAERVQLSCVINNPSKSSVWSRLGPEKGESKETDTNWTPDEAIGDEEDEDIPEGVDEEHGFLKELGNKLTGDEMDTIARKADHPYFLRSLLQSEGHDGPSGPLSPPSIAPSFNQVQLLDSRQLYNIPQPNIPLLPHARGSTAAECYEALDARDQGIRKGEFSRMSNLGQKIIHE